jgi:hypothetical protein
MGHQWCDGTYVESQYDVFFVDVVNLVVIKVVKLIYLFDLWTTKLHG